LDFQESVYFQAVLLGNQESSLTPESNNDLTLDRLDNDWNLNSEYCQKI